jgi:glycosyltransferase involved in cell wall biosynthesis/peptidoglycan/xylan/chitin deacetylase (PgdA/CDA1 family)
MKKVLIIAYHFPPDAEVGGVRPSKFAKYLRRFDWKPYVLTVKDRYHPVLDEDRQDGTDSTVIRTRFFRNPSYYYRKLKGWLADNGLTQQPASLSDHVVDDGKPKGATLRDWINTLLAFPDEQAGWVPFAVFSGIRAIRQYGIGVVLTSSPPHSAHLIGALLKTLTGTPWVADFRDPFFITEKDRGLSASLKRRSEAYLVRRADLVLTTAQRLTSYLALRYPTEKHKFVTLPNGYDPDDFSGISLGKAERFTISYTGTVYLERDPEPLLRAVSELIQEGRIDDQRIALRFIGDCDTVMGKPMSFLITKYHLESVVELTRWLPKKRALEAIAESHVLFLLVGDRPLMVPAKVYEYLWAGGQILALIDDGSTADLLREVGNSIVIAPNDYASIKQHVQRLYDSFLEGNDRPNETKRKRTDALTRYSRESLTRDLAELLNQLSPAPQGNQQPSQPKTGTPRGQVETIPQRLKKVTLRTLTSRIFRSPLTLLPGDRAVIFMLHRFSLPDLGIEGHDPSEIKQALEYLRHDGYQLISLAELLERASGHGPPLHRAVVFTMDDGYFDQSTIAAPLFASFDCPVTIFVVTGFVDGQLWLWWDQIEYLFLNTDRRNLNIVLGDDNLCYQWTNGVERESAQTDFTERCKEVVDTEKRAAIQRLALEMGVELPKHPPPQYAPMSWDQLRSNEKQGMTFGPQTVTHPVLTQLPAAKSQWEITVSWEMLCAEAARPIPVFAYPNGRSQDFGSREIAVLKNLGFLGAVSSVVGYISRADLRMMQNARFRLPRFSYPDSLPHVIQDVSGLEHFKRIIRRETP